MAQAGGRLRRINEALREVIAECVQRELADPRLSFLTITHVRATQDLKEAKVFWTTLDRTRQTGRQQPSNPHVACCRDASDVSSARGRHRC